MTSSTERIGWGIAFLLLAALGIPWFLWGVDSVVAGLPVWIWWHVGWMVLAAAVFWLFTQRSWGLWIESDAAVGDAEASEAGPAKASASGAKAPENGGDRP